MGDLTISPTQGSSYVQADHRLHLTVKKIYLNEEQDQGRGIFSAFLDQLPGGTILRREGITNAQTYVHMGKAVLGLHLEELETQRAGFEGLIGIYQRHPQSPGNNDQIWMAGEKLVSRYDLLIKKIPAYQHFKSVNGMFEESLLGQILESAGFSGFQVSFEPQMAVECIKKEDAKKAEEIAAPVKIMQKVRAWLNSRKRIWQRIGILGRLERERIEKEYRKHMNVLTREAPFETVFAKIKDENFRVDLKDLFSYARNLVAGSYHGQELESGLQVTDFLDAVFKQAWQMSPQGDTKIVFLRAGADPLYEAARLMARLTGNFPVDHIRQIWATMNNYQEMQEDHYQKAMFIKYLYDQKILTPETKHILFVDTDTGIGGGGTALIFAKTILDNRAVEDANITYHLNIRKFNEGPDGNSTAFFYMYASLHFLKNIGVYLNDEGIPEEIHHKLTIHTFAENKQDDQANHFSDKWGEIDNFLKTENIEGQFHQGPGGVVTVTPKLPYNQRYQGLYLRAAQQALHAGLLLGVLETLHWRGIEVDGSVAGLVTNMKEVFEREGILENTASSVMHVREGSPVDVAMNARKPDQAMTYTIAGKEFDLDSVGKVINRFRRDYESAKFSKMANFILVGQWHLRGVGNQIMEALQQKFLTQLEAQDYQFITPSLEGIPVPGIFLGLRKERGDLTAARAAFFSFLQRQFQVLEAQRIRQSMAYEKSTEEGLIVSIKSGGFTPQKLSEYFQSKITVSEYFDRTPTSYRTIINDTEKLAPRRMYILKTQSKDLRKLEIFFLRPTKTVVVADDEQIQRRFVSETLQDEGYQVATAQEGREALGILRSRPIDLVMSDQNMSGWDRTKMNGDKLLESMREDPDLQAIPFVARTGAADEQLADGGPKALQKYEASWRQDGAKALLGKSLSKYGRSVVTSAVDQLLFGEADSAMSNTKGGIDLNSANVNLQIKRDGKGISLPLAQQDLAQLSQIQGFVPVILEIKPASALPLLNASKL